MKLGEVLLLIAILCLLIADMLLWEIEGHSVLSNVVDVFVEFVWLR